MSRMPWGLGFFISLLCLAVAWIPQQRANAALDTIPPSGTIFINNNLSVTNNHNVTLSLTWSDGVGSGVTRMRFSNDGKTWTAWEPLTAAKAWTVPDGEGYKTVRVQYRDAAGNNSTVYNDYIRVDTIPPTGSILINNNLSVTNSRNVTLSLTWSDGAGSGVTRMRFSIDGRTWTAWELLKATRQYTLPGANGHKTVRVQYRDAGGNNSAAFNDYINLQTNEPVMTPNVVGQTQAVASSSITGASLTVGSVTEQYHATVPIGRVISQNPAAGTSLAQGSAVALMVSRGPEPVLAPNVVGQTQAAAALSITDAGLTVGAVTEQYHATTPVGKVISQNPAAGASVVPGSAVNLVVSIGQPILSVTPAKRLVGAEGSITTFSVANTGTGMMNWSANVTVGGSWCRITSGMIGTNSGTVNVVYDTNSGQSPRTGEITVTAGGAMGSPVKVKVEQTIAGGTEETILLPGNLPLVMVWVPAGSFMMGRYSGELDSFDTEDPQHQVTVPGFWMGKYEVTQAQWKAVMNGDNPSYFQGMSYGNTENRPVDQVNKTNIKVFLTALNAATGKTFRLPSEAEWEYAARAGTTTRFYWGDDLSFNTINHYAWHQVNSNMQTHDVGTKLPNAFGLYDMSGNILEWCDDFWHSSYTGAPIDGSSWIYPSTSSSVLRGGSWISSIGGGCRSAFRYTITTPSYTMSTLGLRLAR
ncbi:MAG: SUMF1/EgtB/PvdO family nonheme iron enzyme [Candidatus Hydrogenedentes bacterium]|nr:SUMF1/EgtB/PvdO family nonheme iron enzyme [Candidatus Hydrogenedentota bacterium]